MTWKFSRESEIVWSPCVPILEHKYTWNTRSFTSYRPQFIFVVVCAWDESPRPYAITSIDLFVVMVLNLQIFTDMDHQIVLLYWHHLAS
jgi:hypothetical protein